MVCKDKVCDTVEVTEKSCESDSDCESGQKCNSDGKCEGTSGGPYKLNWLTFGLQQDLAMISGTNVCSAASQKNDGYACFRSDGKQYHGVPKSGAGDGIAGGISPATTRLMIGFDRAFLKNITGGAKLGIGFRGGPAPDGGAAFFPVHFEVRGTYWFGKNPLSHVGFRPFALIGGGLSEVDVDVQVNVTEDTTKNTAQTGNPNKQKLDAWKKMGKSFATLGGGVMYAMNPKGGIVFDVRAMMLFPSSGMSISPEIGYSLGF
jgi:hypothetical protein